MTAALRLVVDGARPERPWLLGGAVRYLSGEHDSLTDLTPESLAAHHDRFGGLPLRTPDEILDRLETAELSGLGGARFPVARKWRSVRASGGRVIAVANGAEGEPLSRKDAALLELRPHLVLDGLEIAVGAVGADEAILWLDADSHTGRSSITRAVAERCAHRSEALRVRIEIGPTRYLTGQASAVANALSGGPALPMFRRSPLTVSGIGGRPTLVQNVETLARVALLARDVPAARSTLLTVAGRRDLVVVEARSEVSLGETVRATVGKSERTAVLLGGYGGAWARWPDVADLPVDEKALRAHGHSLGAGVVLPLAAGSCGLQTAARIARYLADSGARQCGPCLYGLPAIANLLDALVAGRAHRHDLRRLERYLPEVSGRGACHHPDGAVRMVASALATFDTDVRSHLHGRCAERGR